MQKISNTQTTTRKSRFQTDLNNDQQLFCKWLQQGHRSNLIQRIKMRQQNNIEINEGELMKQHYRHWLELTKPIHQLIQHPLLTKKDFKQIDGIIENAKQDQIKHGLYGASGTWLFYMIFLRRFPTMQRIFNQRDRWIRNWSYRILAGYGIFLGWIMTLNSYNQDSIQNKVRQKGLYKKYHLKTEDVNA